MVSVFPMHCTDMLSNPADNVTRAGKLWEECTPFAVAQSRFTSRYDTNLIANLNHPFGINGELEQVFARLERSSISG